MTRTQSTEPMKALVIGGGGFLGRHLLEDLFERGHEASVYDIRQTFQDKRFPFHVGDILDVEKLVEAMQGKNVVFHCASPPYHLNDRNLFMKVNVEGTKRVIEACKEAGIQKLVLTSSCSVIYNGSDLKNADETTPIPSYFLDFYTETKMLQEKIVMDANSETFFTVAIRPHGIFGPNDHTCTEIIKKAQEGKMKFIIGDGSNLVDFTYVRNVTYGHILAAEQMGEESSINGEVFHITNDEPIQFWIFVSVLLNRLGYAVPQKKLPYWFIVSIAWFMYILSIVIRPFINWQPFLSPFKVALAGTHHYYSCEKAKRLLGYEPVVALEKGIDITVDSLVDMKYRASPEDSTKKTR